MTERDRVGPSSPRRRRLAAVALALAGAVRVGAVEPAEPLGEPHERYPDLYTARVVAEDRGALDPALAQAMRAMLVRLTGQRRPEASPGVKEALADPERFVQQYRFEAGAGYGLTVRFDAGAVDALVERLGLGRWSRVRPRVIVWLAVEDEQGRKSYVEPASREAAAIASVADERGMPFVLPLFDIEDRLTLPLSTLWGGFTEPIERASRRYAADAILAGRVYRDETGFWNARWTQFGEPERAFRTDGNRLETTIAEGLHQVADRFAARFARRGEEAASARVAIVVSGVGRLEDYARLMRYLASIDIVENVQVARVDTSHVRFVVRARGGRAALAELIALGRTLAPEPQGAGPMAGGESALAYRLR